MQDLRHFFEEEHFIERKNGAYTSPQWGAHIVCNTNDGFDIDEADIVLVGCNEWRGADDDYEAPNTADRVREQLYALYHWHSDVRVADAGNIARGATLGDTRAALRTVLEEIHLAGKTAVIIGGSHDLTLQQYEVFKNKEQTAVATVVDMLIDLNETETITDRSYLMDMLSAEPNFMKHYNHIGFQSYMVHPQILETLDKLRFDCYRLGKARDNMEDMEPVMRGSDIVSFDLSAIKYSDAPANRYGSPNGFTGEEACLLARYAGMSAQTSSFGIFGFDPSGDRYEMTSRLVSQMIWYFTDGYHVRLSEAQLHDENEFLVYHLPVSDHDTIFAKSKRTGRWWMKMSDGAYIPCSYTDYILSTHNEIPERWMREHEKLI